MTRTDIHITDGPCEFGGLQSSIFDAKSLGTGRVVGTYRAIVTAIDANAYFTLAASEEGDRALAIDATSGMASIGAGAE